jgi:hypothetical protein
MSRSGLLQASRKACQTILHPSLVELVLTAIQHVILRAFSRLLFLRAHGVFWSRGGYHRIWTQCGEEAPGRGWFRSAGAACRRFEAACSLLPVIRGSGPRFTFTAQK